MLLEEVDAHLGKFHPDRNSPPVINSNKFDLNYIQLLLIKKKKQEKYFISKTSD